MKKIKAMTLLFLCLIMAALTGCHEKAKAQMQADATTFCEDFKNMDFQGMYNLTHDQNPYFNDIYTPDSPTNQLLFETMANNMTYYIGECTVDGKNATVKAKIENLDMNTIMNEVLADYFEQCDANPDNIDGIDLDQIIKEHTEKEDAPRQSKDTVFNFIKQDGKWVIESNVMIYDDVTGGYMTYYFQTNIALGKTPGGKGAQ